MSASLPALLSLLSSAAAACATCFGQADGSGLYDGFWWGIVVLLAVTFALVGGFAWMLWRVEKARMRAERA